MGVVRNRDPLPTDEQPLMRASRPRSRNLNVSFDVLIVGGGLIGSTLALALAGQSMRVGVLEAGEWVSPHDLSQDRALALSLSSSRIFQTLGLWPQINAIATPITQVQISDAGHFGGAHISAADYRLPALGYVTPANQLLTILQKELRLKTDIHCFTSTSWDDLRPTENGYEVDIHTAQGKSITLSTRLLVAADGSDSKTRRALGIGVKTVVYDEQAIVGTAVLTQDHHNIAYERFTKRGPLAFLPLKDDKEGRHQAAFVWTVSAQEAESWKHMRPDQLRAPLQQAFGNRLGRLQAITQFHLHPLRSQFAAEQILPGAVLLGNAAHTLHPVAAQGLNTSLKDTAALAQILVEAWRAGKTPGEFAVLENYIHWREKEQKAIAFFTDNLIHLFADHIAPVAILRGLGLCGLDALPPLKKKIAKMGMGLAGRRLPKLVCGVCL